MFTLDNYPKAYGNIRPNFYRLQSYLRPGVKVSRVEAELWRFVSTTADSKQQRKVFKSFPYIGSGWEWSVFQKDDQTVIKIPAGIFPEVEEAEYLANVEFAYQKILDYFPSQFVAKSRFRRLPGGLNLIEQVYLKGKDSLIIQEGVGRVELLENIRVFLESALTMLEDYHWLPDLNIRSLDNGFKLRNVVVSSNRPQIIDFTAYYDVYRLYPCRTKKEVKIKRTHITQALEWIDKKEKKGVKIII